MLQNHVLTITLQLDVAHVIPHIT